MANRNLTNSELISANELLAHIRKKLIEISNGDSALLFAYRRKISKELIYDERGKPSQRNKIKLIKRVQQHNKCPLCSESLPVKNCVLDRIEALKGYTPDNTRLLCEKCDRIEQERKKFA
jgi:ribosomal protein L44E